MDRHPRDRTDRRPSWWVWLLIFVILLAAWYWVDGSNDEAAPAPAPPVDISSPAGQAADADDIERPAREPRRLERSETTRTGDPADTEAGATPGEPPVPLSPRP